MPESKHSFLGKVFPYTDNSNFGDSDEKITKKFIFSFFLVNIYRY